MRVKPRSIDARRRTQREGKRAKDRTISNRNFPEVSPSFDIGTVAIVTDSTCLHPELNNPRYCSQFVISLGVRLPCGPFFPTQLLYKKAGCWLMHDCCFGLTCPGLCVRRARYPISLKFSWSFDP